MSTETKKSGMMAQIIVGVVIALCVGGSSPWWLKEVKEIFVGPAAETQAAQSQSAPLSAGGPVSNSNNLAGINKSDISTRQQQLEAELEEIQKQQEDEAVPSRPARGQLNITGTWHDADSQATFVQIGNTITFEEFTPGYGRTAVGQGTISGNEITMTIQTIFNTQGTLEATVSADGKQISGTYTDLVLGASSAYSISR